MIAKVLRGFSFTVLSPLPKARPRFGQGRTYTPDTTRTYERAVGCLALEARMKAGLLPFEGGVSVEVWLYLTADKGDVDNYLKAILDGMNTIAFLDDAQVLDVEIHKRGVIDPTKDESHARVTVRASVGLVVAPRKKKPRRATRRRAGAAP